MARNATGFNRPQKSIRDLAQTALEGLNHLKIYAEEKEINKRSRKRQYSRGFISRLAKHFQSPGPLPERTPVAQTTYSSKSLLELLDKEIERISFKVIPFLVKPSQSDKSNEETRRQLQQLEKSIDSLKLALRKDEDASEIQTCLESLHSSINDLLPPEVVALQLSPKKPVSKLDNELNDAKVEFDNWVESIKTLLDNVNEQSTLPLGDEEKVPFWKFLRSNCDLCCIIRTHDIDIPRDGRVIPEEDIRHTERILRIFAETVGLNFESKVSSDNPVLPFLLVRKLPEMAGICLLLKYMGISGVLDSLLNQGITDKEFPIKNISGAERILGTEYASRAGNLIAQQYRIFFRKEWTMSFVDLPIQLHDGEPLPFALPGEETQGSFAWIGLLEHGTSPAVLKMSKRGKHGLENFKHIKNEFEALRTIAEHHHLAKAMKSFIRTREDQQEMGIILARADCDLAALMLKYFNGDDIPPERRQIRGAGDVPEHCKHDRDWTRLVLLNAFGCLSHSLFHIHKCNLRHKDIKPDNILVQYKTCEFSKETLVLADFGLAHYFGITGRSGTNHDRFVHRNTAPEVGDCLFESPVNSPRASMQQLCGKPIDFVDAPNKIVHDLPEDVYALGLVFLEILSILIGEFHNAFANRVDKRKVRGFFEILGELDEWISGRLDSDKVSSLLKPFFKLAQKMISRKPTDRPTAFQVFQTVEGIQNGIRSWAGLQDELKRFKWKIREEALFFCHECVKILSDEKSSTPASIASNPSPPNSDQDQSRINSLVRHCTTGIFN